MAARTTLEKKYQRVRDEAVEFAMAEYEVPRERVIVSFSEHDCIVDVVIPNDSKRFVYFYEEDGA